MANREVSILEKTFNDPNSELKQGVYLIRDSFYQTAIHTQDDIKNVGFDWRTNLMDRTLSKYLLSNDNVATMVNQYRTLMVYLIEKVQDIKKAVNYTVDKHYKHIS